MEIQEESYEYLVEHEPIIGDEPFGLTEEDIERAIGKVREGLGQLKGAESSPKKALREYTKEMQPFVKMQLEFLTAVTPTEVLGNLRKIYDRVKELQESGVLRNETGIIINQEFPDAFDGFHEILRGQYAPWANRLEGADIVYRNLEERRKQNAFGKFVRRIIRK